jgi:hypothetical protein
MTIVRLNRLRRFSLLGSSILDQWLGTTELDATESII